MKYSSFNKYVDAYWFSLPKFLWSNFNIIQKFTEITHANDEYSFQVKDQCSYVYLNISGRREDEM